MYNHEPAGYDCPFCKSLRQNPDRIIARTDGAAALLGLHRWGGSPLDVLVIPVEHIENLYDLPARLAPAIQSMTRAVALGLKEAYGCEGVSTRQHNEPAGNQDVWHFHVHVFPRYTGDNLYRGEKATVPADVLAAETVKLREYFTAHWEELFKE